MGTTTPSTGVHVHREGPLAFLRLDGADRLNPIGTATCRALADAVRQVETDGTTRAVIVHGAGRAFSAGADIAELGEFTDGAEFTAYVHAFTDALALIERSPLPFVAALNGPAFGGGLELALACDLRVAAPGGKLGLPEAKLGALPGAGGTQRLPRLVPYGVAIEMLMLGAPVDGTRAYAVGLVNRLADDVLAEARGLAAQLVGGAALVPARTKSLLRDTQRATVHEGIERERAVATELFVSPDGREGFAAFLARRPPAFAAAPATTAAAPAAAPAPAPALEGEHA
ncbi:enoyl-CoA hydratase/isomerase family protein [Cryptosporangium sp. NPDC051539]|uniref:enoyl-CoA hydratase/isomerase family protein n=1 Tax=Cryptosporangium sp. NPDC051539 TaxID=3363962 RepID=UPI0037AC83A1